MMIKLQLLDGKRVTVNVQNVTYFQPSNDQTLMFFVGNAMLYVKDTYEEVAAKFDPER